MAVLFHCSILREGKMKNKKRLSALFLSVLLTFLFATGVFAETYTAYGMVIRTPGGMKVRTETDQKIALTKSTRKMYEILSYDLYPGSDSISVKAKGLVLGLNKYGCSKIWKPKLITFKDGRQAVFCTGYKRVSGAHEYVCSMFVQLGSRAILVTDIRDYAANRSNPYTNKLVLKLANTVTTS